MLFKLYLSTFLCILLISYNTYLSPPHPQLFPEIFASINPIKILLKPDCLSCLTVLQTCFTKLSFTFLLNSSFCTSSLSFPPEVYCTLMSCDLVSSPSTLHHLQQWQKLNGLYWLLRTLTDSNHVWFKPNQALHLRRRRMF